jgi:hypothetical protein
MSIFSKQPKKISGETTAGKLFEVDTQYLKSRVKANQFKTVGEALRAYVHVGIQVELAKERGKDETMFAVVKKQQEVVLEGTRPLVEKLDEMDEHLKYAVADLLARMEAMEAQTSENTSALKRLTGGVNRLLEISVICYGLLRHYVLGVFVVRLSKTSFEKYAEGFRRRLEIFRTNMRAGNLLLEGDYEAHAEEFARGLTEATSVPMPASDGEQKMLQNLTPPVLGVPFEISDEKTPS